MIISCHTPKTAGTTFAEILRRHYGNDLIMDYGDRVGWAGEEADRFRQKRGIPDAVEQAFREGRRLVVHGHFYASKYAKRFPNARLITFVREPVSRVISNYQYLRRNPQIEHPLVKEFHRASPSLAEWANWPWARDLQSKVLDVPLENFSFVGISEHFGASLELFDVQFRTPLASLFSGDRLNVSSETSVPAKVRDRIEELNIVDVAFYKKALKLFENARAVGGPDIRSPSKREQAS